jgi:YbbR domain-containing protein
MRLRAETIVAPIVSLGLALSLWFAVAGERVASVSVAAPVEFRNVPEGLELVGTPPRTLDVWVRGRTGLVRRLRGGDVYVPLDLAGARSGSFIVHVGSAGISVPYGVRVMSVEPASLAVTLERTVQKSLPIRPTLAGQPARGYRVTSVTSVPAEVIVAGPENRIAALDGVPTEPVLVDQAKMSLARDVSLSPLGPSLRVIDPQPVRVSVRVEAD